MFYKVLIKTRPSRKVLELLGMMPKAALFPIQHRQTSQILPEGSRTAGSMPKSSRITISRNRKTVLEASSTGTTTSVYLSGKVYKDERSQPQGFRSSVIYSQVSFLREVPVQCLPPIYTPHTPHFHIYPLALNQASQCCPLSKRLSVALLAHIATGYWYCTLYLQSRRTSAVFSLAVLILQRLRVCGRSVIVLATSDSHSTVPSDSSVSRSTTS